MNHLSMSVVCVGRAKQLLRAGLIAAALAGLGIAGATPGLTAGAKGTADEAVALVKKAKAAIMKGRDKAIAEISTKDGPFVDRDLYVVVYDSKGTCLAHGANQKLIGQDLSDNQDVDGVFYVRDRVQMAATKPSFWQDYKFTNPTTKKIEPKSMYCETADKDIVCAGIYK